MMVSSLSLGSPNLTKPQIIPARNRLNVSVPPPGNNINLFFFKSSDLKKEELN